MNLKIWHLIAFAAGIIMVVIIFLPNEKEQGVLLARSGKIQSAEAKLEPVLKKNPLDYRTVLELAKGYNADNKPETALKVLDDYLKRGGNIEKVEKEILPLYIENSRFEDAVALLEKDKKKNIDELINLSVRLGELKKAVEFTKYKLSLLPKDSPERLKLLENIQIYQQWQLNMTGVAEIREKLASIEQTMDSYYSALELFIWNNNQEKMKYYADKVADFNDLPLNVLRVLRSTWIKLRDPEKAVATARKIITSDDADYTDWLNYITLLEWTNKKELLLKELKVAIGKYPEKLDLYWKILAVLPNDGKSLQRAEYEQRLFTLNGDLGLLVDAAQIYRNNKMQDKVLELYRQAVADIELLKQGKQILATDIFLAEAYLALGKVKESEQYFEQVYQALLQGDPGEIGENIYFGAADYAKKVGKKLEQANIYVRLYQRSNNIQVLMDARNLYAEIGADAEALKIDKKLLALGKLNYYEKLQMLELYLKADDKAGAQTVAELLYQEALTAGSGAEDDLYWSALDATAKLGNKSMRARILQKFYQQSHNPELLREAAAILKEEKKYQDLLAIYRELKKNKQLSAYDVSELFGVYAELKLDKALKELTESVYAQAIKSSSLDKEREHYYQLMEYLPRFGLEQQRVKLLEKYAAGGDIESAISLAGYYIAKGEYPKAKQELTKILASKGLDKKLRLQAEEQLANLYSNEFYATQDPQQRLQIMAGAGSEVVAGVIKDLEADMYTLSGAELRARQQVIDNFRELQIEVAFLNKNYIRVDQLVSELYNPDSAVYLNLASLYFNAKEEESARRYFAKVLNTKGFSADQYSLLGYLYLSFGENQQALRAYLKADDMTSGLNKDIRIGLADVYGRLGEAEKQYRIVDFYTTFPKAKVVDWVRAADARAEHNDYIGEYAVLQQATARLPDSSLLLAKLVSRLVSFGREAEAVTYAKRLEGLKVSKVETDLLTVGYGLLDVGQVREAGRMFAVASNIDPKNKEARLALARFFVACFQYPQAHRIYQAYLQAYPDEAGVWYEYGVLKQSAGFVGAVEAFTRAKELLQNGKQGAGEMSMLASIAYYLGKPDAALAQARYAYELDRKNEGYALNLAELYNSYNYPKYAVQAVEAAGENEFNAARRDNILAEAELLSRRFMDGIAELKKVLTLEPDNSSAQLAKGYSEVEIGAWMESSRDLIAGELSNKNEQQSRLARYLQRPSPDSIEDVVLPELEEN